jgi:hypothetical protein
MAIERKRPESSEPAAPKTPLSTGPREATFKPDQGLVTPGEAGNIKRALDAVAPRLEADIAATANQIRGLKPAGAATGADEFDLDAAMRPSEAAAERTLGKMSKTAVSIEQLKTKFADRLKGLTGKDPVITHAKLEGIAEGTFWVTVPASFEVGELKKIGFTPKAEYRSMLNESWTLSMDLLKTAVPDAETLASAALADKIRGLGEKSPSYGLSGLENAVVTPLEGGKIRIDNLLKGTPKGKIFGSRKTEITVTASAGTKTLSITEDDMRTAMAASPKATFGDEVRGHVAARIGDVERQLAAIANASAQRTAAPSAADGDDGTLKIKKEDDELEAAPHEPVAQSAPVKRQKPASVKEEPDPTANILREMLAMERAAPIELREDDSHQVAKTGGKGFWAGLLGGKKDKGSARGQG